ncbi:TetR/AcrR family transcriptional regulator [Thaumasiovibrio subtropicus]|uniref:TetR/AcrR family transcriptional regulator n=1 Tax=Thaumasiovibrio subtropicus TaxID=1891207 RepID=UPI000B34F1D0|nr:TetR/AcrR family transcriptional regulator [Thaumasiovibrio subtropicus]
MKPKSKRELILEAATKLFIEHGYGVSMDNIAKQAGVSKQTVYSHFSNKDSLYEVCIADKCQQIYLMEEAFGDERLLPEVLFEFGLAFHKFMLSYEAQSTFKAAVSQQESHPNLAKAYLNAGPERTGQRFAEFLTRRQAARELREGIDTHQASVQFLLMCHGRAVIHRQIGQTLKESDKEKRHYIQECVNMFLAYYGA